MVPEFNIETFMQERQDIQLSPEKQAEVDALIEEFKALPDKPESLERIRQIIERLNELYGPADSEPSEEMIEQFHMHIQRVCELLDRYGPDWKPGEGITEHLQEYPPIPLETISFLIKELARYESMTGFEYRVSFLLSLMINRVMKNDSVITIDLTPDKVGFSKLLNHFGFRQSCGKIIIKGNLGNHVGQQKTGGTLEIQGDVGEGLGSHMDGGEITVFGSADKLVGLDLKSGTIKVSGEVGEIAGYSSEGGEIHVGWKINGLIDPGGKAKIYHKGKLIHGGP